MNSTATTYHHHCCSTYSSQDISFKQNGKRIDIAKLTYSRQLLYTHAIVVTMNVIYPLRALNRGKKKV